MGFLDNVKTVLKYTNPIGYFLVEKAAKTTQKAISNAIRKKILSEASSKAAELESQVASTAIRNVLIQNGLLIFSIVIASLLGSTVPFYLAYTLVLFWNIKVLFDARVYVVQFLETRSLLAVIKTKVSDAIDFYLEDAGHFERWVLDALGPDIEELVEETASHIYPRIKAFLIAMTLTLTAGFVIFRLILIPLLSSALL